LHSHGPGGGGRNPEIFLKVRFKNPRKQPIRLFRQEKSAQSNRSPRLLDGNELADSVHDKRCAIEGAKIAILSAVHQPVGSVNGRTALAQLAAQDGERFFEAALEILERMPDSSTERGTVHSKLCDCPAFLIQLTRPDRFSRSKLLELCRNFIQFDKRLDVRLADLLPHRHEDSHHLSPDSIAGILDVLNEISAGPRLVLLLNHLTDYPDPVVAERAVVLMGRRIQNSSWSQRFLTAQDEGMRASAVESMWGRKSPAARTALWGCVNDTSSQVAGKAVFGLHLLGESGIDEIVTGMLDDTRPSFRSTAAEVMGKIGREEYAELLMKATTDIDPGVRLEAKRALVNIRRPIRQQEAAAAAALPDLPVSEPPVLALPLESPALDLPVPEPPVLATPLESPAPELPLETPRREPQFEIHLDGRYTGRR
jgi:hypothetical protein